MASPPFHVSVPAVFLLGLAVGLFAARSRFVATQNAPKRHPKPTAQERKRPGQPKPEAFFGDKDEDGLLRIDLRYIDTFLRWGCGKTLLEMGLFPNAKEITESMACVETLVRQLGDKQAGGVSMRDPAVVAVVVGDGRTPRP